MKIINVQTNVESITIGGSGADMPGGSTFDVGNLAAVIRGTTYADDATNLWSVVIGPGSVLTSSEIQPFHEFDMGFTAGAVIAPVLVFVLFVRKYFARGDACD